MISKPDPIDVHVGSRVRLRRTLLGLSQQKLGDALGLTFQQIQKYERGANRIGASRLYRLSRILDVDVTYFYEDMPAEVKKGTKGLAEAAGKDFEAERLSKRETLELVRAYYRVTDRKIRKRIFELIKAIARGSKS